MTTQPQIVTLGEKYRDTITGFVGTATSRHEYMYGCVRVTLEGDAVDGKAPEELSFDEQRLEVARTREIPRATATSGGGRPAPPARTTGRQ